MRESNTGSGRGWAGRWDLVVLAALIAFDDLRNAVLLFLASQDVLTLAGLMALVWLLRGQSLGKSFGLGGIGKMRLFDGFFGKFG